MIARCKQAERWWLLSGTDAFILVAASLVAGAGPWQVGPVRREDGA